MIEVITHNGRMPADGGLRLGYLADHIYMSIGSSFNDMMAQHLALIQRINGSGTSTREKVISNYVDLSMISYLGSLRYCRSCGATVSRADRQTFNTTSGSVELEVCTNCGIKYRKPL